MHWSETGVEERAFALECFGRSVPAVLWMPANEPGPFPLVLAGHGFTMNKHTLYPLTLPRDLVVDFRLAVAAIDVPGHGERQPDRGRDAPACEGAWRDHWQAHGAKEIAEELRATLDELQRLPEIGRAAVGYWGLSLGTQYGVGFLAEEPRVVAAVLGLSGLPDPGPRIAAYAAKVDCPVFFIQQLDDEVASLERSNALFERLASKEKILRSNPGRHMAVPGATFEDAYRFLAERLRR